jgi:hypothetical protein
MSPIYPGLMELLEWTLYDQVPLEEKEYGQQKILFQLPLGAYEVNAEPSYTKEYLHTNLYQAAQIEAPNKLILRRFNILFFRNGLPLRVYESDLYARTAVDFAIMHKTYRHGPAWSCASPLALFDTPRAELPRLEAIYGIKWENLTGSLIGDIPTEQQANAEYLRTTGGVVIGCQEPFQVTVRVEGPTPAGIVVAAHLDGPFLRAIQ